MPRAAERKILSLPSSSIPAFFFHPGGFFIASGSVRTPYATSKKNVQTVSPVSRLAPHKTAPSCFQRTHSIPSCSFQSFPVVRLHALRSTFFSGISFPFRKRRCRPESYSVRYSPITYAQQTKFNKDYDLDDIEDDDLFDFNEEEEEEDEMSAVGMHVIEKDKFGETPAAEDEDEADADEDDEDDLEEEFEEDDEEDVFDDEEFLRFLETDEDGEDEEEEADESIPVNEGEEATGEGREVVAADADVEWEGEWEEEYVEEEGYDEERENPFANWNDEAEPVVEVEVEEPLDLVGMEEDEEDEPDEAELFEDWVAMRGGREGTFKEPDAPEYILWNGYLLHPGENRGYYSEFDEDGNEGIPQEQDQPQMPEGVMLVPSELPSPQVSAEDKAAIGLLPEEHMPLIPSAEWPTLVVTPRAERAAWLSPPEETFLELLERLGHLEKRTAEDDDLDGEDVEDFLVDLDDDEDEDPMDEFIVDWFAEEDELDDGLADAVLEDLVEADEEVELDEFTDVDGHDEEEELDDEEAEIMAVPPPDMDVEEEEDEVGVELVDDDELIIAQMPPELEEDEAVDPAVWDEEEDEFTFNDFDRRHPQR